jgi:uncharacterized protein
VFKYPDAVIMVFCKAPILGQVKTRLMPQLTAQDAAKLHCELSQITVETATQKNLCEVQLWCTSHVDHQFFVRMSKKYSVTRRLQVGEDLGERMNHAFCNALSDYNKAILIGCDCPSLTSDDLDQALTRLSDGAQCIISPAEDGGYVLIGLKQAQPELFSNMPWGTDQVLDATRAKIEALGIRHCELSTQWDIDSYQDLLKYREMSAFKHRV